MESGDALNLKIKILFEEFNDCVEKLRLAENEEECQTFTALINERAQSLFKYLLLRHAQRRRVLQGTPSELDLKIDKLEEEIERVGLILQNAIEDSDEQKSDQYNELLFEKLTELEPLLNMRKALELQESQAQQNQNRLVHHNPEAVKVSHSNWFSMLWGCFVSIPSSSSPHSC